MSEVVRNQLEWIDEKISLLKEKLSVIRAEQKTLEDELAVLEGMAKLGNEYLAKESPPQMHPVSRGVRPPSSRKTGMRDGSRKQRIWTTLQEMLTSRGFAIHKSEIIDHMAEIGLMAEDRKESVSNLLSEFKRAELINSDGFGFWFLPHQITNGVPWYDFPLRV
jgi:hypothetical protein